MQIFEDNFRPGAVCLGDNRARFTLWAPAAARVDLHILEPHERLIRLERVDNGYYLTETENTPPETLYYYRLDQRADYPDPASVSQPQGVHGPSQLLDSEFPWQDRDWRGLALTRLVIYEMHIGTFSREGTFDAVIPCIRELKALGITALELMPVTQFPGGRNWGYDTVFPYAVQHSYGGPEGLKRLVNACHREGLGLVLDVVYNHLGPEGNYLGFYGPYFTDRYHNPWGRALNFDGPHSDEVRRFFIGSALRWLTEFHVDALRLDALHAIPDFSPRPFIRQLAESVQSLRRVIPRKTYLIAENDTNDRRYLCPPGQFGFGLDAQWNEDFHHALHTLLTREESGYYQDYGKVEHLAAAFREGYVYSGQYSAFRQRRHGSSSRDIAARRFVVFSQNHDQVGNRPRGIRLSGLVNFEQLKLAAATVILSPFIPLIFMGEEYAETAPFLYFVDHADSALLEAVRAGRRREFPVANDHLDTDDPVPDPAAESTFQRSRLDHRQKYSGFQSILWDFYRELFRLRREIPALRLLSKKHQRVQVYEDRRTLQVHRWNRASQAVLVCNFSGQTVSDRRFIPTEQWEKALDSADTRWLGPGSLSTNPGDGLVSPAVAPHSAALWTNRKET